LKIDFEEFPKKTAEMFDHHFGPKIANFKIFRFFMRMAFDHKGCLDSIGVLQRRF